jgi:hypothetical protein
MLVVLPRLLRHLAGTGVAPQRTLCLWVLRIVAALPLLLAMSTRRLGFLLPRWSRQFV